MPAVSRETGLIIPFFYMKYFYAKKATPHRTGFLSSYSIKAAYRTRTGCIIKLEPSYNNEYLAYRIMKGPTFAGPFVSN